MPICVSCPSAASTGVAEGQSNFNMLLNVMLILCISTELATNLYTSNSAAFCQFIYWKKAGD